MNIGTVQGGTNAGWKRQKPAPKAWACICVVGVDEHTTFPIRVRKGDQVVTGARRVNPGYLARCPDCGEKRR